MWTVLVEVALVVMKHPAGVLFVEDQYPVGALSLDTADEPFRERVRRGSPGGRLDHVDALRGEYRVERTGVLGIPVADEEPEPARSFTEIHDKVAGLLRGPLGRGVRGDAEDVCAAGRDLHDEQDVQPAQRERVGVKEVGGEQPGRLRPQDCPPVRAHLSWRRADPIGTKDPADRAGADPVAQADQFALDPPVTPV
jgi:hypothetical protein